MPRNVIDKRSDPHVLQLRKVRDGKDRSLMFCEGEKLVKDLFDSAWRPRAVFCSPEKLAFVQRLLPKGSPIPVTVLSESVMAYCSDLTTPQGVIALAQPPLQKFVSPSAVDVLGLVIHGVQLPQNVGALLRTAEGAGVTEVHVSGKSADPWGPKALRGSSGSAFRVTVRKFPSLAEIITHLRGRGIRTFAACQHGQVDYHQANWTNPSALVVGSEGAGFTDGELKMIDQTVRIPMKGRVESLNVSTAAAVCLFEAARQRAHGN